MRQPVHDFHVDPHAAIGTFHIGEPSKSSPIMANHSVFMSNAIVSKTHAFCGKKCLNLSAAKLDDNEKVCFNTCLTKYDNAVNLLSAQRSAFNNTIAEIKLNGGDQYERINNNE